MEFRQYRIFIDFTGNDDNFNGIVEIDYYRNGLEGNEPILLASAGNWTCNFQF